MRFRSLLFVSLALFSIAIVPAQSRRGSALQSAATALERLQDQFPTVGVYRTGARVSRIYGAPFGTGFSPEQAASSFVAEHGAVFDLGDSKLLYAGSQDVMDGKFTAVYFNQSAMGLPVYKGHVTVLVQNTLGSPIVLASSSVHPVAMRRSLGRISGEEAKAIALKADKTLSAESEPSMVAYPLETDTVLAWSLVVGDGKPADPKRFTVFVDATSGEVLEWRDEVFYVDVTGNVKGWATPGLLPNQPNNPAALVNLVDVTARVVGGNSVRTNGSGNFTIPHAGATLVTAQSELLGTWVNVNNSGTGGDHVLSMDVTPPGPANFVFNPAHPNEFTQAQVDGFIHTQVVHNFAKAINSSYPGIDIAIPCNVNLTSNCNAFYSNSTINFYDSGGGCPNTAFSTVVYHEYGHFIINKGHPTPSGDYHEGIADVTASLLANNACLGQDFRGQDMGCLRNAINSVTHPCSGGVHLCGQVISGAFWLTKLELEATMGAVPALAHIRSLYLNSILLHPSDINPGVTIDVLTLDDNDGNIFNGTPHYTEIAAGFNPKGLTAPELEWLTITPINVPGEFWQLPALNNVIPVQVSIADNVGTVNSSTAKLVYRANGGAWSERAMLRLSSSSPYYSFLHTLASQTVLEWYVEVEDMEGHTVKWPAGDPRFTAMGSSFTTTFNDTFDGNLGWTVTNDPSLTTGAWTRANPNGTTNGGQQANPENDSNDSGTFCMFTGQGTVGGALGAADVDFGPTTVTSPVFDLSGANGVIDFQRWFYNDDGDDSLIVQISNNGGTSWTTVETVMYTGSQNAWTLRTVFVNQVVAPTNSMRMRFVTSDNPNNSITEAAIDAFRVRRLQ